VRFGITRGIEGEAPDLALSRGGVRVVDSRSKSDAARLHVAAPDLEFVARGADTETVISGGRSRVCELDHFVQVGRTEDSPWVAMGECAEAGPNGVALQQGIEEPTIGIAGADPCELDVLAAVSELFDPRDVAAPPAMLGFPGIDPAPESPRDPCDNPGSGCAPRIPTADETPPTFIDPGPGDLCSIPGLCDGGPELRIPEEPPQSFIDPGPGDLCALGAC
jgi:hypothetical protein